MKRGGGDPLWNTRRRRLDLSLVASFGVIIFAMKQGPEMALAVVPPAFIFAGMVLGAYFGAAEWGRVNGALGMTETRSIISPTSGERVIEQTTKEPRLDLKE